MSITKYEDVKDLSLGCDIMYNGIIGILEKIYKHAIVWKSTMGYTVTVNYIDLEKGRDNIIVL